MPLESGSRLGAYEIINPLGAGGMGEVYRAKDNKLGREVAIKVLPEEFTQHPQKLARFEREARLLAALNHPGIATLHGLEKSKGKPFLVMELVEGETLAQHIERGPIPQPEALQLSVQITEALEAAHEKGVIHRDLKPANIKVDPEGHVKVLDFGLAKAFADEVPETELSQSPTLSRDATRAGVILGTAAYMSPEQAKGKAVDKRSDIFSFGAVLYEMLTGKKAFGGEDVSDVLASIIKLDIDWKALPSDLDPRIQKLLSRCLKQDRKKRLRDIGDVRNEVEEILAEPKGSVKQVEGIQIPQRKWPWVAAIAAAALIAAGAVWLAMRPEAPRTVRSTLVHPGPELVGHQFDSPVALSSDGRRIVYIAQKGAITGVGGLYVRRLDELEPTLLAESARSPFFSPDGQWVGFRETGVGPWMRVAVTGGPAVPIGGEGGGGSRGATWGPDDTIVFAGGDASTGLFRISASGGEAEILTTPDSEQGETDHLFPEFLPGGRTVLFTISNDQGIDNSQIAVLDLDTREYRVLIQGGSDARYAASGHIIYGVAGTLRAVPFDLDSLEVRGTPTPVVDGVVTQPSGGAAFAVSPDGSLAYVAGSAMSTLRTPVWVDRDGKEELIPAEPRGYEYLRIAHDGQRVAFDECNTLGDIWVWNFRGENAFRLTTGEPICYPVWTSDDARIAFSYRTGFGDQEDDVVFWKASNNTGLIQPVTPSIGAGTQSSTPYFFSAEDQVLVFREQLHADTQDNIGMISLEESAEPEWLLASEFNERNAELSPDERFMAYQSDESGQFEVYVRPFPNVNDDQWVISTAGGSKPLWSRDGRELFYIEPGSPTRMMSVPVQMSPTFEHESPQEVMEWPYEWGNEGRNYDVSPDGSIFLTVKPVDTGDDAPPPQINIVTNWFEELKRLVPTNLRSRPAWH